MNIRIISLGGLLILPMLACSTDDNSVDQISRQVVEGCKHVKYGGELELDASQDSVSAPSIHARYALTLGESEGNFGGAVEFTSMGGTHMLFLSKTLELTVRDSMGTAVETLSTLQGHDSCTEVEMITVVDLPEGNYTFEMAGATEASVTLVIHAYNANHDHDHGHDHGSHDHDGDETNDDDHDGDESHDDDQDGDESSDEDHDGEESHDDDHDGDESSDEDHDGDESHDDDHDGDESSDEDHDGDEPSDDDHDGDEPNDEDHDGDEPNDEDHDGDEPNDEDHDGDAADEGDTE